MDEKVINREGYDALWLWFGLSRASWLTLPRVLMHEMPDEWQAQMTKLLKEWDAAWDSSDLPTPHVSAKKGNRFTKWPSWVTNYRHPENVAIDALRNRE